MVDNIEEEGLNAFLRCLACRYRQFVTAEEPEDDRVTTAAIRHPFPAESP